MEAAGFGCKYARGFLNGPICDFCPKESLKISSLEDSS